MPKKGKNIMKKNLNRKFFDKNMKNCQTKMKTEVKIEGISL